MGVLSDKIELFSSRLIVETIRQWMVLVLFVGILVILFISMVTLIKNHRSIFVTDVVILFLLQIRILLLIINDFGLPHRFVVFCSDLVLMSILTIIFYKFTQNLLK